MTCFVEEKKCKFRHGRKKLIFDAQGDAYLYDGLSYASPSCHIQLYYADDLIKRRGETEA